MNAEERAIVKAADDYVTRAVTVELAGGDAMAEIPDDVEPEILWATLCVSIGTLVATLVNWARASGESPEEVWRDCCLRLARERLREEDAS